MFLVDQTKVFSPLIWLMYPFIPIKPKQRRFFSVLLQHKLLSKRFLHLCVSERIFFVEYYKQDIRIVCALPVKIIKI